MKKIKISDFNELDNYVDHHDIKNNEPIKIVDNQIDNTGNKLHVYLHKDFIISNTATTFIIELDNNKFVNIPIKHLHKSINITFNYVRITIKKDFKYWLTEINKKSIEYDNYIMGQPLYNELFEKNKELNNKINILNNKNKDKY